MSRKIAVIGSVGVPGRYGGFETLVENLASELGGEFDLTIYCSGTRYPEPRPDEYRGARLVYLPLDANGPQSVPYDVLSILHGARRHDLLLLLGVGGAIALPLVRLLTRATVVAHIGGVEWRRAKWGRAASWFLRASEWLAMKLAHEVISDNDGIREYVEQQYGRESRLIAYGGDHVTTPGWGAEQLLRFPFLSAPYAFTVCRIEPENNIHLLLEAYPEESDLALVIVGNWNASRYGRQLRERYGDLERVHLLDPIYEPEVLDVLRGNCTVYLHGHSVGGTNPSLVEAMHLGRTIIAYDVIYNRATTENRALYFSSAGELRLHLEVGPTGRWLKVAREMKRVAMRRYCWHGVVLQYSLLFQGIPAFGAVDEPGVTPLALAS